MTDDAIAEIAALRQRLAHLEAMAATPPGASLEGSIAEAMDPPPRDPARRKLESRARGFLADPSMEDALRQRAAMGAPAYDAEMRRVGISDGLERALYTRQREAAIKLGTFVPEEGTSND